MDNPVIGMIEYGGEMMRLHKDGGIARRTANGWTLPSKTWRIIGAVCLNNFGHVVERFTLDEVLAGKIIWQHKNRKQRVHVLDFDHGTNRMWGCPNHSITIGGTIW